MKLKPYTIVSHDGVEDPSMLLSWLHYRNLTNRFATIPYRNEGKMITRTQFLEMQNVSSCPVCGDERPFIHPELGLLMCICDVLDQENEWVDTIRRFGSPYRKGQVLDDLNLHGDQKAMSKMQGIKVALNNWIAYPEKWVILYGFPGCGKSHMLEALAQVLYPAAMYVSSEDMIQKIFMYTSAKELDLGELISAYARIPILLFDDWGMGHDSSYTLSILQSILNLRYRHVREFPTMVSTNLSKEQMFALDDRVTSRLMEASIWVDMTMIPDYRLSKAKRNG